MNFKRFIQERDGSSVHYKIEQTIKKWHSQSTKRNAQKITEDIQQNEGRFPGDSSRMEIQLSTSSMIAIKNYMHDTVE